MKNKLTMVGFFLFFCPAFTKAELSIKQIEQLKQEHAPVIQQLKENPPDVTNALQALNNNDIQETTTEPNQVPLDVLVAT